MADIRARLDKVGVGPGGTTEEAAARIAALARLRGEFPGEVRRRAGGLSSEDSLALALVPCGRLGRATSPGRVAP